MSIHDIILIGAGPSGVSACRPLAESKINVLWLDAGHIVFQPPQPKPSLNSARSGLQWAQDNYQRTLNSINFDDKHLSPKLRLTTEKDVLTSYADENKLNTNSFKLIGALGAGGLSKYWGAFAPIYDDCDLGFGPLNQTHLYNSYLKLSKHMGLNGSVDDDLSQYFGKGLPLHSPPELSPALKNLLQKYSGLSKEDSFSLGRARSAILTENQGNNPANC